MSEKLTSLVGEEKTRMMHFIALRGALKLETLGMCRSHSPSAYSIVKQELGFKGNKQKVLEQLDAWLAERGITHKERKK